MVAFIILISAIQLNIIYNTQVLSGNLLLSWANANITHPSSVLHAHLKNTARNRRPYMI